MKLLFISDLHGSYYYTKKAIEVFNEIEADYIVILGDELYHGPRNPLPEGYSPKDVALLLNQYKNKIVAIKGNCDSEVDQMVLDFPILSDFSSILYNKRRIFLSHGHTYNEENLPAMADGDVFAFGHIHIPVAKKKGNIYIINPGSIALPKENSANSYGVLVDDVFQIKDFDGNVITEIDFNK